jgi:hypothetical protein
MSRTKGTDKTGGRAKGTPNKVTADLRAWVECLINKNLSKMEKDLKKLEPKDRLVILERLMQYTIPKQQSISVEAQIQAEYASLEKLLSNAPDEVIKEITERVMKLNQLNSKENE